GRVAVFEGDGVLGKDRRDGDGPRVRLAHRPVGDVDMVRAPVGQLAAGIFVPPAEFVMTARPAMRLAVVPGEITERHGSDGALPEVPIEAFWRIDGRDLRAGRCAVDDAGGFFDRAD